MNGRTNLEAARLALFALEAAWPAARSSSGLYIFVPDDIRAKSADEAITTLEHLPKPLSCLAVPLWGHTAVGVWPATDLAGGMTTERKVLTQFLTNELEQRGVSRDEPVLVHRRDEPTEAGLLVDRTVIENWLTKYHVIGLECSVSDGGDSTLIRGAEMRVQLAPATFVSFSQTLWSKRSDPRPE